MDDVNYFLVIRLGPKTSECEKSVTVVSSVTSCEVTNCATTSSCDVTNFATTLHGFKQAKKKPWHLFFVFLAWFVFVRGPLNWQCNALLLYRELLLPKRHRSPRQSPQHRKLTLPQLVPFTLLKKIPRDSLHPLSSTKNLRPTSRLTQSMCHG